MAEILDWVSLMLAPGLGVAGYWRLVDHFDGPDKVLSASREELLRTPGIRAGQVGGLGQVDSLYMKGEQELLRLHRFGGQAIIHGDAFYPELLRQINDPPPVLYVYGRKEHLCGCCLGMVGARAASSYGRRVAFSLSARLAEASVTIVSGLAMGVDAEAHRGALSVAGSTIAVLGCGLDVVYPTQNSRTFARIREEGLLVTEYPLSTPPDGFRFPARNRIIAGMSRGIVVVEAARKSGSLITAQFALDEGRDVFAVPGQVDSVKSEGTHWLLKQGASLVLTADDVLDELRLVCPADRGHAADGGTDALQPAEPDALKVLNCIDSVSCSRDELIVRSGLSAGRVSEILLFLELDGFVEMLPGDEIRRIR
ncbi:MAG: DNA-processing protein DprA [Desulfocapsaceae bacterium]|nr:DNA-processing protein DprA [Desulfocapsaceae bacterium]